MSYSTRLATNRDIKLIKKMEMVSTSDKDLLHFFGSIVPFDSVYGITRNFKAEISDDNRIFIEYTKNGQEHFIEYEIK